MKRALATLMTMCLLEAPVLAAQHGTGFYTPFEQRVRTALHQGRIDLDTYFLQRFAYLFSPSTVSPRWVDGALTPSRSATELVRSFQEARQDLRPATVQAIDTMLEHRQAAFVYDTEHYRISFDTTGFDAVPPGDVDEDGVPDFIEDLGAYAEHSWWREFDDLGFVAPKRSPAQGHRLHVIVQQMNAYGMTICTGFCTIRVDNDFAGFPSNDDPDGPAAGAAKVTIAHELKHASQWETSNMTELGWIELDATWMEDVVYPEVNDYVHYVESDESQVVVPTDPLDKWLFGSYADAIWQISMSDRFGAQLIVDLWDYRAHHRLEGMLNSYDAILQDTGSDLVSHFCFDYMVRNYLTGARTPIASDLPVYPDAARYPEGPVTELLVPDFVHDSLPHLAGVFFEALSDGSARYPGIVLEADEDAVMGLTTVLWFRSGDVSLVNSSMVHGRAEIRLNVPWSRLDQIGIVVANGERAAPSTDYTLSVGAF